MSPYKDISAFHRYLGVEDKLRFLQPHLAEPSHGGICSEENERTRVLFSGVLNLSECAGG